MFRAAFLVGHACLFWLLGGGVGGLVPAKQVGPQQQQEPLPTQTLIPKLSSRPALRGDSLPGCTKCEAQARNQE